MTKPEYIQVQVTSREKELLRLIAEREGRIGFSGVIRQVIKEKAARYGFESVSQPQPVGNNPVK